MISFQNNGLIDIAAVTTMGVSVKEGDGAIGYFGTGLKFAIATILREGGEVTLWRGLEAHTFTATLLTVRGEDFQQVCMNDTPLGFTTALGRNWEPWMAFREMASNCRDENGAYCYGEVQPIDGCTTIHVNGLDDAFAERHKILLETTPIFSNEFIDIHPSGISSFVYYRGVRIYTPSRSTAHTYNIKRQIDLTEDRTAKYSFQVHDAIISGILSCDEESVIRTALDCGQECLEHFLDFDSHVPASDAFVAVGNDLAMGSANNTRANPSVVKQSRKRAMSSMSAGDNMQMNHIEAAIFERAKMMLAKAGHNIEKFPVVCVDTLGPNIHGCASDGKIFISRMPFLKGTREVAATLLEEYAHLVSGQADCTRGFQNWLFDQILVNAESVNGEPF